MLNNILKSNWERFCYKIPALKFTLHIYSSQLQRCAKSNASKYPTNSINNTNITKISNNNLNWTTIGKRVIIFLLYDHLVTILIFSSPLADQEIVSVGGSKDWIEGTMTEYSQMKFKIFFWWFLYKILVVFIFRNIVWIE